MTDYVMDAGRVEMFERIFASQYDPEHYQVTPEEAAELKQAPYLSNANTSNARYIWLPVTFSETGMPLARSNHGLI